MNKVVTGFFVIVVLVVAAIKLTDNHSGGSFHWRAYVPKFLIGVSIPYEAVEFNNHHYHVYADVALTWDEAEDFCESKGGHLAVISSEDENKRLYKIMRDSGYDNAYIGLSNVKLENVWSWINGEPISYTYWANGSPVTTRGFNYARFFKNSDAQWNCGNFKRSGNNQNEPLIFICEWDE